MNLDQLTVLGETSNVDNLLQYMISEEIDYGMGGDDDLCFHELILSNESVWQFQPETGVYKMVKRYFWVEWMENGMK